MVDATFLAVLVIAGALLAWIDLRSGIIPNWLNIAIAAAGLARITLLESLTATVVAGVEGIAAGMACGFCDGFSSVCESIRDWGSATSSCSPRPPFGSASPGSPYSCWWPP